VDSAPGYKQTAFCFKMDGFPLKHGCSKSVYNPKAAYPCVCDCDIALVKKGFDPNGYTYQSSNYKPATFFNKDYEKIAKGYKAPSAAPQPNLAPPKKVVKPAAKAEDLLLSHWINEINNASITHEWHKLIFGSGSNPCTFRCCDDTPTQGPVTFKSKPGHTFAAFCGDGRLFYSDNIPWKHGCSKSKKINSGILHTTCACNCEFNPVGPNLFISPGKYYYSASDTLETLDLTPKDLEPK